MLSLILSLGYIQSTIAEQKPLEGVTEKPLEGIEYHPHVYNDHIGIQNVIVKQDKLLLRSTVDDGSMVRWEIQNPSDEWSFTLDFNDLNLESRESAGIHVFYTNEKPVLGSFKGGPSKFHGFMVGLEFVGKGVELVYAHNDGQDYTNMDEYVSVVDSLNPQRFLDVKMLKMKIICTKKNFKVEIYNGDAVIYDNFRFFTKEYIDNHKNGGYVSLFANYKNVSSGKAFELYQAQLYQRKEDANYSTSKVHMQKMLPQIKLKSEIAHTNVDIQDLIFKTTAITNYIRSVIGDLPETALTKAESEIGKEIDTIAERVGKTKTHTTGKHTHTDLNRKISQLDIEYKGITKKLSELDFAVDGLAERTQKRTWAREHLFLVGSLLIGAVFLYREIKSAVNSKLGNSAQ